MDLLEKGTKINHLSADELKQYECQSIQMKWDLTTMNLKVLI